MSEHGPALAVGHQSLVTRELGRLSLGLELRFITEFTELEPIEDLSEE